MRMLIAFVCGLLLINDTIYDPPINKQDQKLGEMVLIRMNNQTRKTFMDIKVHHDEEKF